MIKVDEMNSFLSDLMIALFNFDEYELSKKKLKAKINRNSSVVYLPNTKHCKIIDENTGYTKLSAFSLLYVLSLIEPTEENHRFGKMWTFQDEETKIDIDKKKEMNFVAFCDNFNIIIFIETHDPNADLIIMGNTPWVMNYYFNLKG